MLSMPPQLGQSVEDQCSARITIAHQAKVGITQRPLSCSALGSLFPVAQFAAQVMTSDARVFYSAAEDKTHLNDG